MVSKDRYRRFILELCARRGLSGLLGIEGLRPARLTTPMNERTIIAWRLAHGLAGYFQFVSASRLLAMPGEDTAQFVMCQILQSNQAYKVKVSAKPPNWEGQKRIDAGLLPKGVGAKTWYGVVEVKWITSSVKADAARFTIIEDCARVASVKTANLNAKFIVVGFIDGMLDKVFDNPHEPGTPPERRRKMLRGLLRPDLLGRARSRSDSRIAGAFPDYQKRVPMGSHFTTGLDVRLLARSPIRRGKALIVGEVLVWQVNKRRGRA